MSGRSKRPADSKNGSLLRRGGNYSVIIYMGILIEKRTTVSSCEACALLTLLRQQDVHEELASEGVWD